ncbi:MAG: cytochrome b5 domain-containing protein [bacterium]|nr:cytochrome b5 domain-containing protein [bacterium]
MRTFTREELARCNGRDGAPAYVAYRGTVYDVSKAFLWMGGRHQALHEAGMDLTEALDRDAPHGAEFLEPCPRVGRLLPG